MFSSVGVSRVGMAGGSQWGGCCVVWGTVGGAGGYGEACGEGVGSSVGDVQ